MVDKDDMVRLIILAVFFFSLVAAAEESTTANSSKDVSSPSEPTLPEKVELQAQNTRLRRTMANGFLLADYSLIDLLIPSKYGFTAGYVQSADRTWEFEYLHGGLSFPFIIKNLGSMSDNRYSVITRSYAGRSSFNVSYGVTYFDFSAHLGSEYLQRNSGGYYPSADLLQLSGFGFNVGIGNRWTLAKNFTIGFDWISWSQPVFVTNRKSAFLNVASNPDDRHDVESTLNYIANFPRLTIAKLQIGFLF